jgi:MFS family permease
MTVVKHALAALRHRDYALIFIGSLASNVGSWMQNVAKAWIINESHSPFWLGADQMAIGLPLLLMLPIAGVLADRFDRRWLIGATNALMAGTAVLLAVLHARGRLTLSIIIATSAVNGTMMAVFMPAYQSLLPLLVPREHLHNAITLNTIQYNVSRVLGPMIGGLILAVGATLCFGLNAASFAFVIVPLFLIRPRQDLAERESVARSLREGYLYFRGRRDLLTMIGMVMVGAFLASPMLTLLPRLVTEVYKLGPRSYTGLLSCFGAGAVIGGAALVARGLKAHNPRRVLPILAVLGLCQFLLGFGPYYPIGLAIIFFAGVAFVGTMARLNTAVLASIPDRFRGRISSFFILAFAIGGPAGGMVAGKVAGMSVYQVNMSFWIFGGCLVLLTPAMMWLVRGIEGEFKAHLEAQTRAEVKP